ncbi:MAG: efflux RND transporter permease subunit [Verrucomicrobia bacterium]|nr:efflux RND transporter permease subunit [Verrucomicrobiota bacterium]
MKLTDLFIRRPVVAAVLSLLILLAGVQSARVLNVRQYPRSDIAVVSVTTAYVGANADLVRGFITTPLERVIASADGIDYIESTSAQSVSTILVHLKLNYDTNAALTQIQAKVAQVRNQLPPEAEAPVIDLQTSDDRFASIYLAFSSKDLDGNQITDYLTRVVQPKLSAVSGVQRADILGARTFAMRIWLKPDRMAALNISPTEVRTALAANNYLSALGATKGSMISVNLVANTGLRTAGEFSQLVIRQQNGVIVHLKDIADVELGAESYDSDVRFDGKKATFMGIWVLPTSNSLDVIKAVRAELPDIRKQLPAGMEVSIPHDSTEYIQDSIHEVWKTLGETLLLVILIIYLFLGTIRSALIPVIAIPISLIGAAFLMLLFGFTINLLTLLAVVLSVGLVVDDAIVVVENVERHLQEGLTPFQAAITGARELLGPLIAMTISLAAVYAPIGIQGGLTGALFREFAFTLAGAVTVSGLVAITLSPMMCSKLLRAGESHRGYAGWINRQFDKLRSAYMLKLGQTLQWRPVTLVLGLCVVSSIFWFYKSSAKELAPKEDQGIIFGIVQASPNSTVDQTNLFTSRIYDILKSFPESGHVFQLTMPTSGFAGLVTKPWSQRKRTTQGMERDLSAKAATVPGIKLLTMTPEPLPGGSQFPLEIVISSTAEPAQLIEFANKLIAKAFQSGLFFFADTDLKYDLPQAEVVFDREKVASLGLNLQQVGADLGTLLGGNYINRFSIQGRSYKVIPQVKRTERLTTDQLKELYVSGPGGKLVQLSTFANIKQTTEPRAYGRFQQLNSARIYGVIKPGVALNTALKLLETEGEKILPKGFTIDYAGSARQLRLEGDKLTFTMLLSFILIFLVLAAQFNSFRDPFIILIGSVPLALSGALLFTFIGFTSLNIYSQIGLITLVGLIAKNGILIVEFANTLQEQGRTKWEAVIEAAGTRLRPILMTTTATVVGHLPLVFAKGPGAGCRNSIGLVLITGMIIGTAFTLFVVPAVYTFLAKDRQGKPADAGEETAEEAMELVEA